MTASGLIRLSGLASLLSGALLLVAAGAAQFTQPGAVLHYILFNLTFFLAHVLLFFALMGMYGFQYRETGRLGLLGFVLSIIANAFFTTSTGMSAFIELSSPFVFIGPALLPVGLLVLAMATARARVLPRGAAWLVFLGPFTLLVSSPMGAPLIITAGLAPALFAAGLIWMGLALRWEAATLPGAARP